ncbi:MAG: DUF554 domain-containing protein [Termitinemataceae bacterium]|nr:MAG: DUF554 domain-containing protein [Termitinemataceae bacterium]
MLGPFVNAIVVVVCGLAGCFFVRGIPARFETLLKQAIGLSIIFVGIKGAMECENILLLIMSLVIGACIGELINIDLLMNKLGDAVEKKLVDKKNNPSVYQNKPHILSDHQSAKKSFSKGFAAASILFCSGSMAIVGSMQSGLQGNHETLYAKSILDGAISIVFGASLGIGVVFSAITVFVYQGGIVFAAIALRSLLTTQMITQMSAVGSLLVAAIGFNFLLVPPDSAGHSPSGEIKVANLIPAIFMPLLYYAAKDFFGHL